MAKYDARKNRGGNWLGLVVFLMLLNPALIPLGVIGGVIYVLVKSKEGTQRKTTTSTTRTANGGIRTVTRTTTRTTTRQEKFDECPQPFFCFHKDKGEHHVKRGKEVDPWDRPDIDISKYQRKN